MRILTESISQDLGGDLASVLLLPVGGLFHSALDQDPGVGKEARRGAAHVGVARVNSLVGTRRGHHHFVIDGFCASQNNSIAALDAQNGAGIFDGLGRILNLKDPTIGREGR
ncbi:unnamed protein product [Pseudo-nitzschia multistriata]|uniref:Uncharacterized protein n=1 Tax=Pseudo-nitzschia multistriata TaxID=183589 RepID=A0A448ZI45_9STRA|nr:unnamed protein product [Pseudo-nitzschia multistriata]